MRKNALNPVVRFAPPQELRLFVIHEHQLDALSQGSPASIMLNFALTLLGISVTAFGTLYTAPPTIDRIYYVFVIVAVVTLIAGSFLLVLWYWHHKSINNLVHQIRAQMPQNPPAQPVQLPAADTDEAITGDLNEAEGTDDEDKAEEIMPSKK
jgi:hypothetical protein